VNTNPPTVANHIVNAVLSHVRNNKDPLLSTAFVDEGANRRPQRAIPERNGGEQPPAFSPNADTSVLHVGLDWGASKTSIKASFAGSSDLLIEETIPTVVGFAKEGILDGVLPNNATSLFGHEALTHRRHLHLTQPAIDSASAAEFARHLRSRINLSGDTEIRAVIGVPASADPALRDNIRRNLSEHFQSVILLPQPFLAALGYRDESRLAEPDYVDPIRNSIFIDLGASATNLCLVQGYYPTADEQITLNFGGNTVDDLLRSAILGNYPEAELSPITIRLLKEKHSFVGDSGTPINVDVIIGGRPRTLDLTSEIKSACSELLTRTVEALKQLLGRCECELGGAEKSEFGIVLTGGGSRIKNFGSEIQRILLAERFADLHLASAGENYKHLVAIGALKAARQAREHQWQQVTR
jgi:rod shape-determining protein MreB